MSWTHTRSKIAHTKKANPNADVTDLRRQLKAERLAEYISKVIEDLTPEQREELAERLHPDVDGVSA